MKNEAEHEEKQQYFKRFNESMKHLDLSEQWMHVEEPTLRKQRKLNDNGDRKDASNDDFKFDVKLI